MAIDLVKEKECKLSSQDICDIISFSIEAAELDGFLNSYIFNRALYMYAIFILYPEQQDRIRGLIVENIIGAWDKLLDDGTIEQLLDEYRYEVNLLADCGQTWFEEYEAYTRSARGVVDNFEFFANGILDNASKTFQEKMSNSGAQEIINIANEWGMNNTLPNPTKEKEDLPQDSLIEHQ